MHIFVEQIKSQIANNSTGNLRAMILNHVPNNVSWFVYDDKIQVAWKTGNPEPYRLEVQNTTKESLVWMIYNNNYAGNDLSRYKTYIQTAMAYLEEDLKILIPQSTKIGRDAKNLKFHLRLPSKNKEEIFRIFE